ncbi:MAG: undecaprenyl-phosphate glucose phosphotransferase [Actinobacteria bacterium]|nr:undecaprenyl-phosphate glucose phosphotransferase [Actinomycetota bacterium]MCL5026475.1 undecaprenyl-phosphate glucose phosphotransferase [Chloroflexota bacterium]
MRKMGPFYYSLVLVLGDIAMVALAYLVGYYVRFRSGWLPVTQSQPLELYLILLTTQAVLTPPIFAMQGLYRARRSVSWTDEISAIFAGVSMATVLVTAITSLGMRDFDFSRPLLALTWALTIMFVVMVRFVAHHTNSLLRSLGIGEDRVLVVGTDDTARLVLEKMRSSPGLGCRPIGVLSATETGGNFHGVPVLGGVPELGAVIKSYAVDEVIIAIPTLSSSQLLELVNQCHGARVSIKVFPDMFQIMASAVNIGDLNGLPLVTVRDVALRGWNLLLKRAMDLSIGAALLVLLSPFMMLIALIVKVTSPHGPVFFTQERVGLDNKPFQTLKFRTMRPDAEKETGPVWARAGDSRTTFVGRFLRRFSMDELPQLINVIIGEMSLVGPRPERPYFVQQFQTRVPRYLERHNEKAGLTGWAQVNGLRGDTSIEERTAYDLWYVENWTVWLDIKILLRTFLVVLRGDNAY